MQQQENAQQQASQSPRTPVLAIDLPDEQDGFNDLNLDTFYTAFGLAVTNARERGLGQLLGHPPRAVFDRPDLVVAWRAYVGDTLRDILLALQLPGEQLTMAARWTTAGPVVINIHCVDELAAAQASDRTDDVHPVVTAQEELAQPPRQPKIYRAPKPDAPPATGTGWSDPND